MRVSAPPRRLSSSPGLVDMYTYSISLRRKKCPQQPKNIESSHLLVFFFPYPMTKATSKHPLTFLSASLYVAKSRSSYYFLTSTYPVSNALKTASTFSFNPFVAAIAFFWPAALAGG